MRFKLNVLIKLNKKFVILASVLRYERKPSNKSMNLLSDILESAQTYFELRRYNAEHIDVLHEKHLLKIP